MDQVNEDRAIVLADVILQLDLPQSDDDILFSSIDAVSNLGFQFLKRVNDQQKVADILDKRINNATIEQLENISEVLHNVEIEHGIIKGQYYNPNFDSLK